MDASHPGSLSSRPARRFGGPAVVGLCLALLWLSAGRVIAASADDNTQALKALADIHAAVGAILHAEHAAANRPDPYRHAAARAINALVGTNDPRFHPGSGNPGDAAGALGHIDKLLDRNATPRWVDALHGVQANLGAAVARLQDALQAHGLLDYQFKVTDALLNMEMAVGTPSRIDALGGLSGALATTTLGVPAGANRVSACESPGKAPAYGVSDGYLAYVVVPAKSGSAKLPEDFGSRDITVAGGNLIIRTAAAKAVAKLCRKHAGASGKASGKHQAASTTSTAKSAGDQARKPAKKTANESGAAATAKAAASGPAKAGVPKLYTKAQAKAGKKVFFSHCISCHGKNLQGVAAPSVAGNDFLDTAEHNGWTLEVIRYLVFNNMPFNAPGELSPKQYSDVLAFLLASNCYPAGNKPFPEHDEDRFKKIQLKPVAGAHPDHPKIGTCDVD